MISGNPLYDNPLKWWPASAHPPSIDRELMSSQVSPLGQDRVVLPDTNISPSNPVFLSLAMDLPSSP